MGRSFDTGRAGRRPRSALTHDASASLLRGFVVRVWRSTQVFSRLVSEVGQPPAELRMDVAAGQLVGVALLRYLLRIEPLASAPTEMLITWLAPALDQHLQPGQVAQGAARRRRPRVGEP